jgi:hypothetical protein
LVLDAFNASEGDDSEAEALRWPAESEAVTTLNSIAQDDVEGVWMDGKNVIWRPNPGPQTQFLECPAMEVLYGGAVGGGKTDGLLGSFAMGIEKYGRGHKGVFFRRNYNDMDDVIERSMDIFGRVYGEKCFNKNDKTWRFPSGSIFQFRTLEKDGDVHKYQGQQYSDVYFDELTQWATPYCYTYMFTRARSATGVPVRFRSGSNPGGPGHSWVKARFVDPAPPGCLIKVERRVNGKNFIYHRCYIPAKLEDNPILMKNDPNYEARIFELSDEAYALALRNGDWNIVAGAAFTEWDHRKHVIPTADIPTDAVVWRSLDWGYTEPFACGWLFMDPRNDDVILGRELYGYGGEPNVGSKEDATLVREKILSKQLIEHIVCPTGYVDGGTMDRRGSGDTIFAQLGGKAMGWKPWPKGPGSRVNQKQMLHGLMKVVNGKSRFKIMECCHHAIRTLPAIPTDPKNPEDVDTHAEDHMYDMIRGGIAGQKIMTKSERDHRDLIVRMSRMEQQVSVGQMRYGGS